MAVLSDGDIERSLAGGHLSIKPFKAVNLTPNGYDLTIHQVVVGSPDSQPRTGEVEVPGLTWFAVGTEEVIELGPDLCGQLWLRTSWSRRGVLASFGRIDAGFRGNLTLSAFNSRQQPLKVAQGSTFAQLVLEELAHPAKGTYGERSGRYQDQRGVTSARD